MVDYQFLNATDFVTTLEKTAVIEFLLKNLDTYIDSRDNISKSIEYAVSKFPHQGGFIILAWEDKNIVGTAVINRTNFEGYFAENILVFLAVAEKHRGTGIAKELIRRMKIYSKGSILVRLNKEPEGRSLFTEAGFDASAKEFILNR